MTRRPYEKPTVTSIPAALLVKIVTTLRTPPALSTEGHVWFAFGCCPGCQRTLSLHEALRVHEGLAMHPDCVPRLVVVGAKR